jgi:hypothetical protein
MLRRILIKFALRMLAKMLESEKDYGSVQDFGIMYVNSDFDEHTITIKKTNLVEEKVEEESTYEPILTVNK